MDKSDYTPVSETEIGNENIVHTVYLAKIHLHAESERCGYLTITEVADNDKERDVDDKTTSTRRRDIITDGERVELSSGYNCDASRGTSVQLLCDSHSTLESRAAVESQSHHSCNRCIKVREGPGSCNRCVKVQEGRSGCHIAEI